MKRNPRNSFRQQKNRIKTKKNINKLKNKKGEIKTEDKEILEIAEDFYPDLNQNAQTNEQELSEQI